MTTLHLVRLLLLLGAAQVAAAQSTVNEETNECHSAEYHRNYLLLEMQKTIDEIRQQLDQQQLQHETDIRQLRKTIEIMSTGCEPATPTLTYVLNGTGGVYATALLNDQLFVTRNGVAQVSVYDKTSLQLHRQLTSPEFSTSLAGLATCATHNYLYVSDWGNLVHRIDLSVTHRIAIIKWSACHAPSGLSVNNARNLLVACWDPDEVQEYTANGTLVREIPLSSDPWHAVELSSGLLAVTRWYLVQGIVTMSMDGRVIRSYGNKLVERMNTARCMAIDRDGYILVADQNNNRILVVNPTLTDARPLPLPLAANSYLQNPRALSLDQSRGRLYVGEYGGQNRLLMFDNVVNIGNLFN